ncbi:hypothetical protein STEG23_000274, partial [Scotinomys teguina]
MAWKAGQGKEEEESRARQQEEKTPVRDGEKTPACHGRGHHVVEQVLENRHLSNTAQERHEPMGKRSPTTRILKKFDATYQRKVKPLE